MTKVAPGVALRAERHRNRRAVVALAITGMLGAACGTGAATRVLTDTLNGDEQAHDSDDVCGAICQVDNQARSDRPISSFVTPPARERAQAIAAGPPRKGEPTSPKGGIGVATRP